MAGKFKIKTWMVIVAVVVVLLLWFTMSYNGLVRAKEAVANEWANVETQYQRRFDLVPNLVETVKGYASHEKELFTKITELRSQWGAAKDIGERVDAAQGLDSAIARLLVVAEAYPQLKANENFLSLQDELAGTENRVAVARTRFNEAVKTYNVKTKRIPTNIIASMFGFKEEKFFEAAEGAEKAPGVKF